MNSLKIVFVALAIAGVALGATLRDEFLARAEFEARMGEDDNPDIYLGTPDLVRRRGYPVESHEVITEDGYILTMHRIPYGLKDNSTNRPVVFLQHGLIASSSDWVIMGPEQGFAYILADAGYDVWMGNARGNRYSRAHVSLNPDDDDKFWEFSWHEMGIKDLPAEIDYVIEKTGQSKIFYAGHSMGTTMFFVLNSLLPQYNVKFRSMHALAPIAFMGKVRSPIKLITPFVDQVSWLANMIGMNEFLPSGPFMDFIGESLCKDEAVSQDVCSNVMFLLCGYDSQELNETALPVMLSHTPAGTATKVVVHFGQEIKHKNKFRQFDYGLLGNKNHYGTWTPPDYDLSLVTAPVYLHWSKNDWFAHPDDVTLLKNALPNVQDLLVPIDSFNHLDYLWAIHVKTALYDHVMSIMKNH